MASIPPVLLKKLYVPSSLRNQGAGFIFQLQNHIAQGTLVGLSRLTVNGEERSLDGATITVEGETRPISGVSHVEPLVFPVDTTVTLYVPGALPIGEYTIEIAVHTREIGTITFPIADTLS